MNGIARARRTRVAFAAAAGLVATSAIAWHAAFGPVTMPAYERVRAAYRPSEAVLLDRHGEVLDAERRDYTVRRLAWVPLDQVSPALIHAVVAGEDRRFRAHGGVDWLAVGGALRDRALGRGHRGASTITMQLATLLDAPGARRGAADGWRRKLAQVRAARGLEARWTKDQILEAYLNLLHFRGELQGIGATTQVLLGKAPGGLERGESLVLAALLPQPGASAAAVASRACARAHGDADCEALLRTARSVLTRANRPADPPRDAPHLAQRLLKTPGSSVVTTLDAATQRTTREILGRHLAELAARNVRDGAAIVVDTATGDVLAYVGSAGPSSRAGAVDGVRAPRQAGSTLKPFLYELAVERRHLTAASLLDDSPIDLDTATGAYIPQNYDRTSRGPVSVRTALGSSLNVPAVRTLVLVGVEPFRDRLRAFGYDGLVEPGEFYGYSLALGSAEVTLWQQAQAYRALARGGEWSPLRVVPDAPAPPGAAAVSSAPAAGTAIASARRVADADASFVIGDVLADRAARVATFGLDNHLNTAYWSAAKTGTSKDLRDNWCVGWTNRYVVAVWVGNFEGDSMHDVSGVTGAAPVWREIMDALHEAAPSTAPAAPPGVVSRLARFTPAVEAPRHEWFLADRASRRETEIADVVAVGRTAGIARVSSPANGMVIALDPDIPSRLQRVPLAAERAAAGMRLRLNGAVIGPASAPVLWTPRAGTHVLALEDAGGRVVDRVLFSVR